MARKRSVFFSRVQSLLKHRNRRWLRLFLSLLTAFSIVVAPVGATSLNKSMSTSTSRRVASQPSLKQGRELYEAGQFADAVEVLQQAAANFRAAGDPLREAMTLSNLSLTYQQIGNWQQATAAITRSINLLQNEQGKDG